MIKITDSSRIRARKIARECLSKVSTHDHRLLGAKANAVILHGLRGHMRTKAMRKLADALEDAGCNTTICDLPQHGTNAGKKQRWTKIKSFKDFVRIARAMTYITLLSRSRGDLPTFIIGYSLGALITIRLLQLNPFIRKNIKGVICLSTPLKVDHHAGKAIRRNRQLIERLSPFLLKYLPWLPVSKVPSSKTGRLAADDEEWVTDPLFYKGPLVFRMAWKIRTAAQNANNNLGLINMPILFLHGGKDAISPLSAVMKAYGNIPSEDKTLKLYKEVRHDIINGEVLEDMAHWLKERIRQYEKENGSTAKWNFKNLLKLFKK